MPRLLVLNNYDLSRVEAEIARGEKPAHHLFGIDALRRAGWEIELLDAAQGPRSLQSLDRALRRTRFPIPFGSLAAQWCARRRLSAADAIYAPCQTETTALAYARALGWVRRPLVALAHHPLRRGRAAGLREPFLRWQLRGTDRFPALAEAVARDIVQTARQPARFSPVWAWGPDLPFYEPFRTDDVGEGVAATGRTGRDWLTFAAAAARQPATVRVFAPEAALAGVAWPAAVTLHSSRQESDLPYPHLLCELARARVIAVPLAPDPALAGLTSLTDALGLGKPVIVTRHPLLDIDVEREGIGRVVAPGDVAGWADAMRWFAENPAAAQAMGRRARAFAESRRNYALFCAEVCALLAELVPSFTDRNLNNCN